jgi:hypothetical protein
MRSPDNRRSLLEHALRASSLAALSVLAVRLWMGSSMSDTAPAVTTASLDSALASWTIAEPARALVNATTLPEPYQRDWLVALQRTGTGVTWTSADSLGGALVAEPQALPGGSSRVTALGVPDRSLTLSDQLGHIDSARTGATGVATWRVSPVGVVRASVNASLASARARDSIARRQVLVIGEAGWEAKFVTAALEEDGWSVAARLTVAPSALVRQGSAATIDTAGLSAVVVLDSTSALDAPAVMRFVNDGGGVVASGGGVRHPALRSLLPRVSRNTGGVLGALLGPAPREGLDASTFTVSTSAVPLERRAEGPVVVGRRVGAGRVVVAGYGETWRLRMTPPDDRAPDEHRAWWSSLVAGVAHSRLLPRDGGPVDEAPLAATIEALGEPVLAGQVPSDRSRLPWDALLAGFAAAALLAEWLSRRLRGHA